MQNLGWEPDSYSQVVGGIGTVFEFCGALLGGFLADRIGRRKIITVGYGGFGVLAIIFGIFSVYWTETWFASSYLILFPFFRALGAVAIFALFMHISWTKAAATMFTSYMAMSNLSTISGTKLAGPLKELLPFDISFIILGIIAILPLLLLFWVDPDTVHKTKNGAEPSLDS